MLGTTSVRRSRASGSLAQVETGVRPISKRIAEKLEVVFKVKRGTYTRAVFPRGRPPRGAEASQALRQISRATGKAPRALESVGPPPAFRGWTGLWKMASRGSPDEQRALVV